MHVRTRARTHAQMHAHLLCHVERSGIRLRDDDPGRLLCFPAGVPFFSCNPPFDISFSFFWRGLGGCLGLGGRVLEVVRE